MLEHRRKQPPSCHVGKNWSFNMTSTQTLAALSLNELQHSNLNFLWMLHATGIYSCSVGASDAIETVPYFLRIFTTIFPLIPKASGLKLYDCLGCRADSGLYQRSNFGETTAINISSYRFSQTFLVDHHTVYISAAAYDRNVPD